MNHTLLALTGFWSFLGSTIGVDQDDPPPQPPPLTHPQIQQAGLKAANKLKDKYFTEEEGPKSPESFQENWINKGITIHPTKVKPPGKTARTMWTKDEDGVPDAHTIHIFPGNAAAAGSECMLSDAEALEEWLYLILEHEYFNTPEELGGGGLPDDVEGQDTPLEEVSNTWNTIKQACEKAQQEKEEEGDQDPDTEFNSCLLETMCGLYEYGKGQMEEHHKDEICSSGNPSGEATDDQPFGGPPYSGGDDTGEPCVIEWECPACDG